MSKPTRQAQEHFERGNQLFDRDNFKGAIAEWRAALALAPQFDNARYNLALAYAKDGQLELAIREFNTVLQDDPSDQDARRELVEVFMQAKRYFEAAIQLKLILENAPDDPAAIAQLEAMQNELHHIAEEHFERGNQLDEAGEHTQAIAAWEKAIEIAPAFAEAHYNLGIAYADQGRNDWAIEEFRRVLALAPDDLDARRELADTYFAEGLISEAVRELNQVLLIAPNDAQARAMLHELNRQSTAPTNDAIIPNARAGDAPVASLVPAIADLLASIPEVSAAFLTRANANRVLSIRFVPALGSHLYRELLAEITRHITHVAMLNSISRVAALDDMQTRAMLERDTPVFQRDLAILEQDDPLLAAEIHFNRGNACDEKNERGHAVREWQHAISLDPDHAGAHYNLGIAYADAGANDAAIDELKHAVRLAPLNLEIRRELAEVYRQDTQVTESINQLRQALRLAPADSETAHMLADAYLDLHMWDEAAAALELGNMLPEDADAWFQIGQAYEQEGRVEDTLLAYRRARLAQADHAQATRALQKLRVPLDEPDE